MTYALIWLPAVLQAAGLNVIEEPGWQDRGHGDMGQVLGVLCHHTAGPAQGDAPSLSTVINGRPDLSGPLAQLLLARSGTFHICAAGLAYHAGAGSWQGITMGNTHFVGIEAENTGVAGDPWPDEQMAAYALGAAAILRHVRADSIMCAGHKEYALPFGRKTDPDFDMAAFRASVQAAMDQLP